MPDIQTIEYRATQLVYSIKFELSHAMFHQKSTNKIPKKITTTKNSKENDAQLGPMRLAVCAAQHRPLRNPLRLQALHQHHLLQPHGRL